MDRETRRGASQPGSGKCGKLRKSQAGRAERRGKPRADTRTKQGVKQSAEERTKKEAKPLKHAPSPGRQADAGHKAGFMPLWQGNAAVVGELEEYPPKLPEG